ncbi:MAG: alanine:cation symporter family protein, partial [Dermabacter sp.]|nr:alanine:cation symporter family protein [Dermabacter sp.]
MSFDQYVDQLIAPIAQFMSAVVFYAPNIGGIEIPLIVVWLAVAAVFMTVWLRFQPITGFKHAIDVVRGRYASKTDPGEVSSFQALATEISGAIGLGNIAGVAVAIGLGGPGAALWIAIFGFFAMSLKMAEATLGTKYRVIDEDGTVHAGPMYFLKYGFKEIGWAKAGSVLAMFYAISAFFGVFGGGNMFQSNQTAMILGEQLGWDFLLNHRWIVG